MKQYHLNLQDKWHARLVALSKELDVPIVDILRQFIQQGLMVEAARKRGGRLILREAGRETEIWGIHNYGDTELLD